MLRLANRLARFISVNPGLLLSCRAPLLCVYYNC